MWEIQDNFGAREILLNQEDDKHCSYSRCVMKSQFPLGWAGQAAIGYLTPSGRQTCCARVLDLAPASMSGRRGGRGLLPNAQDVPFLELVL